MAVLAAVLLAAAGGFAGRELYRSRPGQPTDTSIVVTTSSPSSPIGAQPGPREVQQTQDAAGHPQFAVIRQLLQDHFNAINDKSYDRWRATVTRKRAETMPKDTWTEAYRSTKDGSILIYRIDTSPGNRLRALIGMTSTQKVEDAPPELPKACIRWYIVLPLVKEDNRWKIDTGTESASPRHDECGAQAS
jgi:hypothetical protein